MLGPTTAGLPGEAEVLLRNKLKPRHRSECWVLGFGAWVLRLPNIEEPALTVSKLENLWAPLASEASDQKVGLQGSGSVTRVFGSCKELWGPLLCVLTP